MTRALLALLVFVLAAPASAQWLSHPTPGIPRMADGKPNLEAPAPRTADGKPDLSGIWQIQGLGYTFNMLGDKGPGMLPWAEAVYASRLANFGKDSPDSNCLPLGPRAGLFGQSLVKIVQTSPVTLVLYEESPTRQIFTDGRALPEDPNPAWMGYSVGRWEGETFVVDTIGYTDRTWLDLAGHPHSEALRVTERFRRLTFGRMRLEMTFEDAKTYRAPWTIAMDVKLVPDTELLEYICNENEKDRHRLVGTLQDERKASVTVAPATLARYAGIYSMGPMGEMRVTAQGEQLMMELPGGGGKHQLFAQSERTFIFPATGAAVEFVEHGGQVTHFVFKIVEGDQQARRVRDAD